MDFATLLSYGTTIVSLVIQAYKIERAIQPELLETIAIWKTLVEAALAGTSITEEQVTELDAKIEALSAANAAKEQAIINGTV